MNEATIKLTVHSGHQWFDQIISENGLTKQASLAPSLALALDGIDATLIVSNINLDIDSVNGARVIVEGRLR